MVEKTIIGPISRKGKVAKIEASKVLTNITPIYVTIEVVTQTPKQVERGNLSTFHDATSCLNLVLEENLDIVVARMDFNAL